MDAGALKTALALGVGGSAVGAFVQSGRAIAACSATKDEVWIDYPIGYIEAT